jgi:hypothetical protein
MRDVATNVSALVQYVVEIDGAKHSEHGSFVDAIKAGLLLREQHPDSKVKVRDISEAAADEVAASRKFALSPRNRSPCW